MPNATDPLIPYAINVPGGAPSNFLGVSMFLTQFASSLNAWIALAASAINNSTNKGGTITGVTAGTGLAGGGVSGDVALAISASGVAPGVYQGLTVNQEGQVTAATNENYISGNQTITLSGDVTGSGTTAISTALSATGVAAGTYQGITVNTEGRVTAAVVATLPAVGQTTGENPTGTSSTTNVMMGLGAVVGNAAVITPAVSGRLLVTICGVAVNTSSGAETSGTLRWGTGTPPANGAADTGSSVANQFFEADTAAAGQTLPFSLTALVTGLTLNTAVWFDLALRVTSGTGSVGNVTVSLVEV